MKNWGIFYFIFVLVVSILPCSDSLEAHQLTTDRIEKVTSNKNEGALEQCTSICLCTCCGQNVVPTPSLIFEMKIPVLLPTSPMARTIAYSAQNVHDIWQPPKL